MCSSELVVIKEIKIVYAKAKPIIVIPCTESLIQDGMTCLFLFTVLLNISMMNNAPTG